MIVLITSTLSTVVFAYCAASMTLFADRVMDHSIFDQTSLPHNLAR